MKKIIKRFAAVLLVVLITLLVIPAEQPMAEETYTVYVDVPDSWGTPYIWAWSDSGAGDLFNLWPGTLMTDNGDGFYVYTLSNKYLNLIFSNGGSVQTEDIKVNGDDVEIIVADDGTFSLNYKSSFSTEWENGITVTVAVPDDWKSPYIWAWNDTEGNVFDKWPGAPMASANGKYIMELPDWVTGIIINANNAGVQTMDISVEAGKDIWLTINSEEDVSVSYFGTESEEDTSADDMTTVAPSESQGADTEPGATTTPGGTEDGGSDGDKPDTKRLLYIIIPVAVFVVIILIVTFTGNGKGKKHSKYASEYDIDYRDVKIDDKELDVDTDVDVNDDDLDV